MSRLSTGLILHVRQHKIVWERIIRTYSVTEEAELLTFGSQGKAEVRKRNFTSFAMKAECKRGSQTSDIWQSKKSRIHIFGNTVRDEMRKCTFTRNILRLEVPQFRFHTRALDSRPAVPPSHIEYYVT